MYWQAAGSNIHYNMKCFFLLSGFYYCLLFFSCNNANRESNHKKTAQNSDYTDLKFPPFETVKILYLDKTVYNSITGPEVFDSLLSKKILAGEFDNFTFLDSLGNPLSHYYDSLVLNNEQINLLISLLAKCYTKDNPGFPLCGSQIKDAIVFYDSNSKPSGFIQLGFDCNVYYFSASLNINTMNLNSDSLMKKFATLFNAVGIRRPLPN